MALACPQLVSVSKTTSCMIDARLARIQHRRALQNLNVLPVVSFHEECHIAQILFLPSHLLYPGSTRACACLHPLPHYSLIRIHTQISGRCIQHLVSSKGVSAFLTQSFVASAVHRQDNLVEVQRVLRQHGNAMQILQGSIYNMVLLAEPPSNPMGGWDLLGSYMSNLSALSLEVGSSGFMTKHASCLGRLPSSLQTLDLALIWDHDEDIFDTFWLENLQPQGLSETIRSLSLRIHEEAWIDPAEIDLGHGNCCFPMLASFDCHCINFSGQLNAPNLTSIKLETVTECRVPIEWQCFSACRLLETVVVISESDFHCLGCTFPSSLQHLWLSVGCMQEDGCFHQPSGSLGNLQTMHVSFRVEGSSFSLKSFTSSAGAIDINVNELHGPSVLELFMPPQDDDAWLKVPGFPVFFDPGD